MFQDKVLHHAVATLTNRIAELLKVQNENTATISSNFQHLNSHLDKIYHSSNAKFDDLVVRVTAFEDKLTILQQLQDTNNAQVHSITSLVDERNKYQRLFVDTQEELIEVSSKLADDRLHVLELEVKIEKLQNALEHEASQYQQAHGHNVGLKQELVQLQHVIKDQALRIHQLASERDELRIMLSTPAPPQLQSIQQPQPVQPMGFNMQELASELSKYLNPFNNTVPAQQTDVGSSGLQVPDRTNADAIKEFFARNPSTGMGQNHNTTEHTGDSSRPTSVANPVQSAASLLQPATYMADPAFEAAAQQVDDVLGDNLQFVDPDIAARIKRASGPVQLPSQQSFAYQVAELAASGEVVLPQLPPQHFTGSQG